MGNKKTMITELKEIAKMVKNGEIEVNSFNIETHPAGEVISGAILGTYKEGTITIRYDNRKSVKKTCKKQRKESEKADNGRMHR